MIHRPSRPLGITILAFLEILIGIVGLLASLAIIGLSALFSTLPRVGSLLGTFGLIIGAVVLFFSVISLLGAIGALTIGLITGGVGGLVFWGLMLYYLTRTHVKAFFGKGGLPLNPAYGLPYSLGPQVSQPQIATNAGYGRPSAASTPVIFPPISQGSSTSIPSSIPVSSTVASPIASNSGKSPVCPYCHSTLPMGTRKCLTCGAAL